MSILIKKKKGNWKPMWHLTKATGHVICMHVACHVDFPLSFSME